MIHQIQKVFDNFKNTPKKPKAFRVELPDEYAFPGSFPGAKNYTKPPNTIILDALIKYSKEMDEPIEFIHTDTPIQFYLYTKKKNGKIVPELYQACVIRGDSHPRNLGYYISCTQI